jgi:hypothetical protein
MAGPAIVRRDLDTGTGLERLFGLRQIDSDRGRVRGHGRKQRRQQSKSQGMSHG